jgi:hypothetical protein
MHWLPFRFMIVMRGVRVSVCLPVCVYLCWRFVVRLCGCLVVTDVSRRWRVDVLCMTCLFGRALREVCHACVLVVVSVRLCGFASGRGL